MNAFEIIAKFESWARCVDPSQDERWHSFGADSERAVIASSIREGRACGVPERDALLVASGIDETTAPMCTVREFLAGDDSTLVLAGLPGTGKTAAASWALLATVKARNAALELGRHSPDFDLLAESRRIETRQPDAFVHAAALARMDRFDGESVAKIVNAPFLVIDDLGSEYSDAKGYFVSLVDEIANARYAASTRRTVITTNLPTAQFKARYGVRVAERLQHAGRFVQFKGASLRGRKERS